MIKGWFFKVLAWVFVPYLLIDDWIAAKQGRPHAFKWGKRERVNTLPSEQARRDLLDRQRTRRALILGFETPYPDPPYSTKQEHLNYNHVAIHPPEQGDFDCVLYHDEPTPMPDVQALNAKRARAGLPPWPIDSQRSPDAKRPSELPSPSEWFEAEPVTERRPKL